MRILFTTEGTYPYAMGGVSNWCDQLIGGLPDHQFDLVSVTGPRAMRPTFELPSNVTELKNIRLWTQSSAGRRPRRPSQGQLREHLSRLLMLTADDAAFAEGLYGLARLAQSSDVASALDGDGAWREMHHSLERLLQRSPRVAETALALNWIRAAVLPVLYFPGEVDLAHTVANGLSAIPAWLAARSQHIPLVLTEHGLYLRERYLAFDSETETPGLRLLRAHFHRALAQLIYRDADRCVSVSEFNQRWQIELGAPPDRTLVVYNGVAPELFPPAEPGRQPVPTVSWVGRIDPLKDLDTLISAFGTVRRHVDSALLRLFGPVPPGNEAYAGGVRRLVASNGLQESVRFEGPIRPVYRAYHSADVVALSSVSEGFPYTTIEAMMCGRPVVATQVGGVAEALCEAGKLVEPRNAEQMGEALIELLLDDGLRATLGRRARERAVSLFTLERMQRAYDTLYRQPRVIAPEVGLAVA